MIIDDLNTKIIADYKSGNTQRRVLYQTLKSSLLNKQKQLQDKYSKDDEIGVLKNELKQRQEALEQFRSANRADLIKTNEQEIVLIKEMLPEDMPIEEIEKTVLHMVETLDDKSFGNVMKQTMQELKGKADGKTVSELVKKHLA